MNGHALILFLLFANHDSSVRGRDLCEQPRPDFPAVLRNNQFKGNQGFTWRFSDRFSPVYGFAMWTAIEHTSHFLTEYYVNNFTAESNNIMYHCVKFEKLNYGATVNVWVYQPIPKSYNDPKPSMCELCTGDLRRMHRLTNLASGLLISNDPPQKLSAPYKPDFCFSYCEKERMT